MKCALPGCGADSVDTEKDAMNCMGQGATTHPEGLWCVAGWLRSWAGEYPSYSDFLVAKPWKGPDR